MVGMIPYNETLCPFFSMVAGVEVKCKGVKCGVFNSNAYVCSFRTKSGLIPAFSKAGYSPYLSMDIYTHGYHTYVSG